MLGKAVAVRMGVAVGVAVLATALALWMLEGRERDRAAAVESGSGPSTTLPAAGTSPVEVLRDWDRRRADAFARADAAALAALYTSGSAAGRADLTVLRAYAARGLVVQGMQMQLIEVDPVRTGPDRLVLDVTDRLRGAVAVGEGVRVPLPGDLPSTRRLTLTYADDGWRISRVLPRSGS